MRGSRNFRQGGPGQSDKKSCFFFFFFLAYFTEVKWLISKKTIIVQGSRGCPTFSRGGGGGGGGGPTFSRGVQLLIPYRNPYNCDFPGGSGPPVPPSGSALVPFHLT